MVIAKQCVHCGIGTVIYRHPLCKAGFVICKIFPDAVHVPLFRKGREQPQAMAEIMAQPCGLTHMLQQRLVLAGLHLKNLSPLL